MTVDAPIKCSLSPVLHGGFPSNDRIGTLKRLAEIADTGGFDTFWVEDHSRLPEQEIRASEGRPDIDEPLEAWTTLSFLAGSTSRVRLGTEVTPVTLRHPGLLAKMIASLDVLSDGRVTLGAGTGWHKREFVTQGIPFEPRAERFDKACEAIEVMQLLWGGQICNYSGTYFELEDALVAPPPVQPGGVPVWFGGFSDSLFEALVKYGSGWILSTNPAPEFVVERRTRLREMAEAAGRDPDEIHVVVPLMAHLSTDKEKARSSIESYIERGDFAAWLGDFFGENAREYGLWGTPQDALQRLEPYLEIGITEFIFDLRPPSVAIETAELLASEVLPRLPQ